MAENTQVDVKKLSFERAIEELESIVKRLEDARCRLRSRLRSMSAARPEAALRGTAAAGRGPCRQDHHRRLGPGHRDRAARRSIRGISGELTRSPPAKAGISGELASWRAKRPDIVPPTLRGRTMARAEPHYHVHPGVLAGLYQAVLRAKS